MGELYTNHIGWYCEPSDYQTAVDALPPIQDIITGSGDTPALAVEIINRISGDTALMASITAEAVTRISEDSKITSSITTETANRVAGDKTLMDSIAAETLNRISGDSNLMATITAETVNRIAEDNKVNSEDVKDDEVISEAISTLFQDVKGLQDIINNGKFGNITVESLNSETALNQYSSPLVLIKSAAPSTEIPDFIGQIYMDTVNKKAYISNGVNGVSNWIVLN